MLIRVKHKLILILKYLYINLCAQELSKYNKDGILQE